MAYPLPQRRIEPGFKATQPGERELVAEADVFLGVLVGRRNANRRPYHEQTTFFRRLILEGKSIGVQVFIFAPYQVYWHRRKIHGWTWTGTRWVQKLYPFPHAVYDRVSPRMISDWRGIVVARRLFAKKRVPLFNTRIGSKWKLHRAFAKNPLLAPALPHTRILTTATLATMIREYGEVYVKPANGGQGKGVSWAKRVKGGYVYRKNGLRGRRSGRVRSVAALRSVCQVPGRIMLVQQAIKILPYQARVFDVRALVQRRDDGQWALTGMVARLGAKNRKVSNIHAGGRAAPLDVILQESGAGLEQIEAVKGRIREIALATAETVAQTTRHVGELGVDVAIDTDYRCWLIEANSRTGRISFHRAGLVEEARLADQGPAAYARYLAGKGVSPA